MHKAKESVAPVFQMEHFGTVQINNKQ